ncbi:MAG: radical SAM protein [Candidatus Cloacimonetes bacterium]|nr:radical SAM protein [Candidatus Cloacimonadota bacterium]
MINIKEKNIFSVGSSKLFFFHEAINAWQKKIPHPNIALEIQPSEICDHFCPNCQSKYSLSKKNLFDKKKYGQFIDISLLEKILDAPPSGIIISGHTGEPLLHPEIIKIFEFIKKTNIPTILITNGSNINEELAHLILRTCRGVRISLDACNLQSYKETHGVSEKYWKRTLMNIRMLTSIKRSKKNSEQDCLIGIGYLTNKISANGMKRATILAKQLGTDYIHFRPYHFDNYSIDKELKSCKVIENSGKFRVFSSSQKYEKIDCFVRNYNCCHGSAFFSVLDARGDVYICCHHVGNKDAKIGSLVNQSWNDILKSKTDFARKNGFPNDQCIPHCRMHTHNIVLESAKEVFFCDSKENSFPEMISHAAFL